jgi:hypothetical protein
LITFYPAPNGQYFNMNVTGTLSTKSLTVTGTLTAVTLNVTGNMTIGGASSVAGATTVIGGLVMNEGSTVSDAVTGTSFKISGTLTTNRLVICS